MTTLDDIFDTAADFARFSYETRNEMRPTLFHTQGDPPNVSVFPLLSPMKTVQDKNLVAFTCYLLNVYRQATHSVLALDTWLSAQSDDAPSEAIDRMECILLLGESLGGIQCQRCLKIVRHGNGKFFNLTPLDTSKPIRLEGRFAHLMPDKTPNQNAMLCAGIGLAKLGVKLLPVQTAKRS